MYKERTGSRKGDNHFIYLVKANGKLKIGRVNRPANFKNRFKSIQALNPYEVKPICLISSNSMITEDRLHSLFENFRIRGEWFHSNKELYSYFYKLWRKDYLDQKTCSNIFNFHENYGFGILTNTSHATLAKRKKFIKKQDIDLNFLLKSTNSRAEAYYLPD